MTLRYTVITIFQYKVNTIHKKVNLLIPKNLTKILGKPWVKIADNLSHVLSEFDEILTTKRNVLSYIASIYNPLGLISATHIIGKVIYREEYDKKLS